MQSAVMVAVFRKESRNAILAWLQRSLPTWLPSLPGMGGRPPAVALTQFVNSRIGAFQSKVAKRAAASALDTRCASHVYCQLLCLFSAKAVRPPPDLLTCMGSVEPASTCSLNHLLHIHHMHAVSHQQLLCPLLPS